MIVYPSTGYNSFISLMAAENYFAERLHGDDWLTADGEAALVTAFRSLQELDIVIDLTDAVALQAIKDAQCEQTLRELQLADNPSPFSSIGLPDLKLTRKEMPRFSERALGILRPYLRASLVQVIR